MLLQICILLEFITNDILYLYSCTPQTISNDWPLLTPYSSCLTGKLMLIGLPGNSFKGPQSLSKGMQSSEICSSPNWRWKILLCTGYNNSSASLQQQEIGNNSPFFSYRHIMSLNALETLPLEQWFACCFAGYITETSLVRQVLMIHHLILMLTLRFYH